MTPADDSNRGTPIVCTLDAGPRADRLTDWHQVLAHATARSATAAGGVRVEFDASLAIDDLARLVAAEQQCCAFFSFAITVDSRGTALEVHAPDDAREIVTSLFGDVTPSPT